MAENGAHSTVLLVANEELAGDAVDAVVREVHRVVVGKPEVHIVSPALAGSAFKHQANDIDEAIGPARERLQASLRALHEAGLEASGEVGDADPLRAVQDELLKYDVDRIFLITHDRAEDSAYAEKELLERVEREVEPPATELRIVGSKNAEHVVARRTAAAGIGRGEEGHRISLNLPPLRSLDTAGLLAAIVGTIVLFVLAGACSETLSAACAARYLLAGGFFLINLAHGVALLLMSSVNYKGPFERFTARMSLFGTPLAILVSALVA
jgi:GABA permease